MWDGKFDRRLSNTHHVCVPCLGEVIAVIDKAIASVNLNFFTANKVFGSIELLRFEVHARAVGKDRSL